MDMNRVQFSVPKCFLRTASIIIFNLFLFLIPAHADDFNARHLGDYGNVTVMEVNGNFDENLPDGTANAEPRKLIAKEFYKTHKDEYDFLVIFTGFEFRMTTKNELAFYSHVKNDVKGIGRPFFDNSPLYGSNGRLQGTIDMGNSAMKGVNPADPGFEVTLDTLSHEMLHRWSAYVRFKDVNGNASMALLGDEQAHWSYLLDSKGSIQYGNQWQDSGNGTFTSITTPKYYSPLDLYLMGMIDKSKVPSMLLIDNPGIDPTKLPELGATISGTPRTVTIDDIIAVEGERIPSAKDAQKQFKIAFIYAVMPGSFNADELYGIENIRNGFLTRFSILTDGQGLVQIASTPKAELPVNPGARPPTTVPRTLPPNIDAGVNWLATRQLGDGSWTDFALTTELDTAEAVTTLQTFPAAQQQFLTGLQWLRSSASANSDFLARRLEATSQAGGDGFVLQNELLSRRNPDGGWGSDRNFISNPTDTALALKALVRAAYGDQQVIGSAVAYLQANQQGDGGWSGDDRVSTIQPTAAVLAAFNSCRKSYSLENSINRAIAFLAGKQNPDGGFGNSPSTVYDSAVAIMALQVAGADKEIANRGVAYLNGLQTEDGSWQESPYQTALAVRAVWQTTVDPDLAIKSADISFIPEKVSSLPTNAVVNAVIRNLGRSDVAQATVAIYDGAVAPDKKVGEQTVAFPGMSPVTVTFSVPVIDGNGHNFYVVADPDNLIKESNENNNNAAKTLLPEVTYDFEVLAADLAVSPNPVDMYQEVRISAKIANRGTMSAYNVPVRFYIDESGAPFEIAMVTVDIPAGGSVIKEVTWKTSKAGVNLPLTVQVDPLNIFNETNKANNQAVAPLNVNSVILTDPNLSISYKDIIITPNPVNQTGSVNVAATVRNDGFADAANIAVEFYKGVPGVDGILLGTQIIPMLKQNESSTVSVPWANISEAGEKVISVKVDPANAIKEPNKADNVAFAKLKILSLADLAVSTNSISFTSHAPKDGEPVSIAVTVQNKGDLAATNVSVKAFDGSMPIGSQVIPAIVGNSQTMVSFPFETTGKSGSHLISVTVEGDTTVVEQSTDNNSAVSTLVVYKANLMLSEPYFSPNGDGVKDTTRFSFKLESAQTVNVAIINKKGETVRTFSGAEFTNTAAGSVVWDGYDGNGKIVDDGEYRIKVINAEGLVLSEIDVVVDNDRISLIDSLLAGSVVASDLTCKMPSTTYSNVSYYEYEFNYFKQNHTWLSDGSGAIYSIGYDPFSLDRGYFYQAGKADRVGIFKVSADGSTVDKLTSYDWLVPSGRTVTAFSPSPDGKKIAVMATIHDNTYYRYAYKDEVWVMNIDGSNVKLLDTMSYESDYTAKRRSKPMMEVSSTSPGIVWNPDNKTIAYGIIWWDGRGSWPGESYFNTAWGRDIISVDTETGEKKTLVNNPYPYLPSVTDIIYDWSYVKWSPDGNKMLATGPRCLGFESFRRCYRGTEEMFLIDKSNGAMLYSQYEGLSNPTWLNDSRIVTIYNGYMSVINVLDGTIVSSQPAQGFAFSPDKNRMAVKNAEVPIYDNNFNLITKGAGCNSGYELKFSPDNKKIACKDPNSNQKLSVVDLDTGKTTVVVLVNNVYSNSYYFKWLPDSEHIVTGGATAGGNQLDAYDVNTGLGKRISTGFLYYKENQQDEPAEPIYNNILVYADRKLDASPNCTPKVWDTQSSRSYESFSLWSMASGSNLTAQLVPVRQSSQILLTGTATDLNFEGYKIEYASVAEPDEWYPVIPYAEVPIANSSFGGWVPPGEGNYYVRLTVWDKAGNVASNRQRVSWGSYSSITDIYKSDEIVSPNGDGIKDTVQLNYRVLEPLHVTVTVFDLNNAAVRTFVRDYAAPAVDQVVWDGRNESGSVVPDGTYRFRIADYDFFVKVDTSAPEVNLALSRIDRGTDPKYFDVSLSGRTFDSNIKQWSVEYGEGDNPQQWIAYKSGTGILAARDSSNNVIYPVKDTLIETFSNQKIGWLAGKKFRITAEDYAGKKSSAVTGFVEEKIFLYQWDGNYVPGDVILPDLAKPGVHQIETVETVRAPLASVMLQYSDGMYWHDAKEVAATESGLLKLSWDNFPLNLQKDYEIRIWAKDIFGNEFYSNTLKADLSNKQFKIWSLCSEDSSNLALVAENPYESLKKLSFQIKSSQDSRYADWTDFGAIEPPQGFLLPTGDVTSPRPDIKADISYTIRMKGTDVSGATYLSNEVTHPSACAVEISMEVSNAEADCGKTPGASSLSAQIKKLNVGTKTQSLSYYIQNQQKLQLLRKFDLSTEQWGSAVLDTSGMPEGSYQVSAILTFLDPTVNEIKAAGASATVVVDHVAPTSSITYPGASLQLCAASMPASSGNWFGIPVEGVVADNTKVKRFELLYGVGDNPTSWLPAKTRSGGTYADIKGTSAVTGEIGVLDVTDERNTDLSLKLKVVDGAGNASCSTTTFHIKPLPEVRNLVVATPLFSPNGDGISDRVSASYAVDGLATVETKVYQLNKNADGSFALAATPLRTIAAPHLLPGGMESAEWDGKNDAGIVVADGMYAIAVSAKDGCSNSSMKWVAVEVDKTPPVSVISSPKTGDALSVLVEVRGRAEDFHFKNYLLETGEGNDPATWIAIASGTGQVKENVLGRWNTFGRQGRWTVRLSVEDSSGNRSSSSVPLDLVVRQTVIKEIDAAPKTISPNNDGKLESTVISYEVTDASQVKIEVLDGTGVVVRDYATVTASTGNFSYAWDGKNGSGSIVKDGIYSVRLSATLTANSSVSQIEAVTVVVDTNSPRLEIAQPVNNAFLNKPQIVVIGTVEEPNLASYAVSLSGASGTIALDSGSQPRSAYTFGSLNDLPEGNYALTMTGKDFAENIATISSVFTVDRTVPTISMASPKSDEYYGSSKNLINITGTVTEANLDRYAVRFGSGTSPSNWHELVSGSTLPTISQVYSWKVGNGDGVTDGVYTVSLYAKDKAGAEKDARAKVTIDNTKPTISISSPLTGGYLKAPFSMSGTVMDTNLDKGTLEMSTGECAWAFKWSPIKTYSLPFQNGVFESWEKLPADGDYCLRVSALDKVGNESHTSITIKVDTRPPASSVLLGTLENKAEAALQWTAVSETDLAGYNLYRGTEKLNSTLLTQISYRDLNLKEGTYSYLVKAVDLAGNESGPSNIVKLVLDFTPPVARIIAPTDGSRVSGQLDIRGVADSLDDFKQYRVYLGSGANPTGWKLLRTSPLPTSNGILAQWDSISSQEGIYSIKLEAEDLYGNVNTQRVAVTVDNTPPVKPQVISATASGADVTITWNAIGDADVAGYLLYRNDKIANGVGGSLKSYLIPGTSYVDKSVQDGKNSYYLIVMDQAGNLSDQSNSLSVNIDSQPPHVAINAPKSSVTVSDKVFISASSPDNDIASVQFQYKKLADSVWLNFGSVITSVPYTIYFDPKGLGLSYGYYQVQPLATDNGGRKDPAPAVLNVTYTDITPPNAPIGLKAVTVGKNVTLTWAANTDQDLNGYYVYRTLSGYNKSQLIYTPIKIASYQDSNLADGLYAYEIVAVDNYSNKSNASASATAKIYAPLVVQPFTPANCALLTLQGSNAAPNATVEIVNQSAFGLSAPNVVAADSQGNFTAPALNLTLGENKIAVKATDSLGNVSRTTDQAVVVYNEPPAQPAGLVAVVQDYNVGLTWNSNIEQDLAGYNLYRSGEKVNKSMAVTQGQISSSSYDSYYKYNYGYVSMLSSYAFDGDSSTYWASLKGINGWFGPQWWEIDLPTTELVNHLEVQWGVENDAFGKEVLYAGKDFEVQAWSGYAWIPLTKVTGNTAKNSTFDFEPSYGTNKVRIYVTSTNDPNTSYKQVRIANVKLSKDNLVKTTSYLDNNLKDHKYVYSVTAVDNYGFESGRSDEAAANVGDVIPPVTPSGLTANASGSTVTLSWIPVSSETDLAGYNVYRSTGQIWEKLNAAVVPTASYTEVNLKNGSYSYRVTALDLVGNESAPSSEAAATVSTVFPVTPANLRVTVVPQGAALKVDWDAVVGTAVSYNLYRSTTAGGPYTKIVNLPVSSIFFADNGLSNGSTYYYLITSVDPQGNESPPSPEASGTATDIVPPSIPAITFPATSGSTVLTYDSTTDIAGMADSGVSIELFKGGISLGNTTPVEAVDAMKLSLDYSGSNASVSPNGNALAYMSNSSQFVLQELSGATKIVANYGFSPVWNSTGTTLAYVYRDNNWQYRLGLYDLATGTTSPVTADTYTNESSPSLSVDGKKLAFINTKSGYYDVYLKNLEAGSLTKLTSWINASNPKVSPDGTSVAYFEYSTLKSVDSSTGAVTQIDTSAVSNSKLDWSPDSKKIAFISTKNGYQNLYSLDTTSKAVTALTNTTNSKPGLVAWSPDGGSVAYIRSESDGTTALWLVDTNGNNRSVLQKLSGIKELKWKKNGELLYVDGYGVHIVFLSRHFVFKGIALDFGENLFSTRASDPSGNVSDFSGEIRVIYDSSKVPDASVTADDIFIFPPFPKPGEEVAVNVLVRNNRNISMQNVDVDIYAWDTAGDLSLLKSQMISYLPANNATELSISLNAGFSVGAESVIVVVDGANKISELHEDNNYASAEFYVTDKEEILLTTLLDAGQYAANQDAKVKVTLGNSGMMKDGLLNVIIEDETGYRVGVLDSVPTTVSYGSYTHNYSWNTANTFAGSYRVHAVFTATDGTVTESSSLFAILPDIRIESGVVTDRQGYGANDSVAVTLSVKNNGSNYIVPQMTARVRIVGSGNILFFSEEKNLGNFFPASVANFSCQWKTGLNAPGHYNVIGELYLDNKLVSSSTVSFTINPVPLVTGTVSVNPATVPVGSSFKALFTVSNSGNALASGVIKAVVADPEISTILASAEQPISIPMNGFHAGEFNFSSQGMPLKAYVVSIQYVYQGAYTNIASTKFILSDITPPAITIVSPVAGLVYNSTINFVALASDDTSGADIVEYQLDDGAWKSLPLVDPVNGRYATVWTPLNSDNGTHVVSFRATDKSENTSVPVAVTCQSFIDTQPPVLSVSTLNDGSYTNNSVLNIAGTVTDNTGVQGVIVSGTAVPVDADGSFSYALLLKSGPNLVTTIATDLADNHATDIRTITLDKLAPALTIDSPPDNGKTAISPIEVKGSVDENSTVMIKLKDTVQTAVMNGTEFSATVIPEPCWNTIEITATDLAGNTSSQKRTVLFDDQKPSLAITEPDSDVRTNKSSLTISGKTSDPYTAVGVTVAMDGNVMAPSVIDGIFSQIVTFAEEKLYPVTVTASNGVGTQTTVQRNIIFDRTPPNLTIDPVVTPTNVSVQTVSGTREDGAAVTVTCLTATVGTVEYPTATSWRVLLSGLLQGENRLQGETDDPAGNRTITATTILYVPKAPTVTISASPNQLWPPNKKLMSVVIAGNAVSFGSDIKDVTISIADEYGKYNLQGLQFGDTVLLEAWRDGTDMDGRVYTITAVVTDQAGNRTTKSTTVVVPHDM